MSAVVNKCMPYYNNYALKSHSLSWDLYASLKEDAMNMSWNFITTPSWMMK